MTNANREQRASKEGKAMKKTAAVACGAAALALGLSGCGASYEGSGSKDAASAEQLAQTLPDPWAQEQTATTKTVPAGTYKDGVYEGAGVGMDGKITVTLLVASDKISCVQMTQDGESQSVGGYEAIRDGKYAAQIDAAQGSDIDGISGATITTAGVKEAVDNALDQAKA